MDRLAFGLNATSGRVYSSGLQDIWQDLGGGGAVVVEAGGSPPPPPRSKPSQSVGRRISGGRQRETERAREGADAAGHAAARSGGRRRQDTQRQFIVKSETSKSSAVSGGWEIPHSSLSDPKRVEEFVPKETGSVDRGRWWWWGNWSDVALPFGGGLAGSLVVL